MKIITVLGARPQFIKAAVVSRALEKRTDIKNIIVHTGQHFDSNMSDVFFEEMNIPHPEYHLNIHGGSHGQMTGQMLEKIEEVLLKEKPDIVIVYGDTNSTLAGALAAAKLHVPVAHVEAGLRSFNMKMPEEINRILTDRVSKWLFCPTSIAVKNLKNEGYNSQNIYVVGDVMFDAARFYAEKLQPTIQVKKQVESFPSFHLATIHRAENTDDHNRLRSILTALDDISAEEKIILPLHPRTRKILQQIKLESKNLIIIDPVGYHDMIFLLKNCIMVFTDSGGLQKEAYFFEKPCVTLRDETEWVETIEVGANKLVSFEKKQIIKAYQFFSTQRPKFEAELFGDGHAAEKIISHLG